MILEGIITTVNADGSPNISPMGPVVDERLRSFCLRPFQTSTTFANLRRTREAVFHVTDDVELLARAAVRRELEPPPRLLPAEAVGGFILADACRWYALRVRTLDDSQERAEIDCDLVAQGRLRDFFGFNRAKHAVVEAAILATRTDFLPPDEIEAEFRRLRIPVEKTGGAAEHRALEFLENHVRQAIETARK